MAKNKIIIFLCTAVLIIGTFLIFLHQLSDYDYLPITVSIASGDKIETISCWDNGKGENFVFIPGYVELSDAFIKLNTDSPVTLNGLLLSDGMSCESFELDVQYEFAYSTFGKTHRRSITFVRSGGVGTMFINTDSGNMDYIHAKKGNEESGTISLYSSDGTPNYIGEVAAINGRGNSTWQYFDKKPYSITLTNEADLLEMGKAQKWILLSNASDSSNLRNKLAYKFADLAGMSYSPDSQWVDLYLNGEYAGLYLLAERNEVHPERVNISSQNGFLVSLEMSERLDAQNYAHIFTKAEQDLRVHYPYDASADVLEELNNTWQSVENAILAEDGIDTVTGKSWQELIDLDSWAKKYLIDEIFGNHDACFISQYFYCDGNSEKIFAGPVWDYDLSIGCDFAWQLSDPHIFLANRLQVRPGYDAPWFYSLYQKDDFINRVVEIYRTEFLPILQSFFSSDLSGYSEQISQASAINKIRWFEDAEDLSAQTEFIRNYMTERIAFLNSVWLDNKEYLTVCCDSKTGAVYAYYAVYPGNCLNDLPVLDDIEGYDFLGWYYKDTDEPFDITKPITEDIEIYAKWEDSLSNKMDDIIKLIPIGVIALMFMILFVVAVKRMKGSR